MSDNTHVKTLFLNLITFTLLACLVPVHTMADCHGDAKEETKQSESHCHDSENSKEKEDEHKECTSSACAMTCCHITYTPFEDDIKLNEQELISKNIISTIFIGEPKKVIHHIFRPPIA